MDNYFNVTVSFERPEADSNEKIVSKIHEFKSKVYHIKTIVKDNQIKVYFLVYDTKDKHFSIVGADDCTPYEPKKAVNK